MAIDLDNLFKGISKKMTAHIEDISSSIPHHVEQGVSNEKVLIRFLSEYLPKRYSIDRGMIMSPDKSVSRQIDIIIYDAFNFPPIYTEDGFLLAAIDAVYAVIEVKTTLNKSTLIDANEKARSVIKTFPVSSNTVTDKIDPPVGLCFAFQSDTSLKALWDVANEMEKNDELLVDFICVLNNGVIVNSEEHGLVPIEFGEITLLFFLVCLVDTLADMSPRRKFNISEYFK